MKNNILIILIAIFAFSCNSVKLIRSGSNAKEIAINNAIVDFINSRGKLYNEDSVFRVSFTDSVYLLDCCKQSKEGYYYAVRGRYYEDYFVVSILGWSDHQYLYSTDSIRLEKHKKGYPERFLQIKGKLFIFDDKNTAISSKMIEILSQYNLLQDDDGGWKIFAENATDDAKKGVSYFFCKNDLSKYKRVVTNRALGYYKPPKLNCDCKKK